jgi:uroporphyrinogen-III synthase
MFEAEGDLLQEWMKQVAVACIGPITAKTAEEKNLKVSLVPPEYTIESLIGAIAGFFTS